MKLAKRESAPSKSLSVGLDVFSIVAINPTIEELRNLYETEMKEDDKEIVYVDEKDEVDRVKICIYVKGQHSKKIGKITYYISDKIKESKDGSKIQYINQVCENTWSDSPENISNWFLNFYSRTDKEKKSPIAQKEYRPCMEGEADFYEFVRGVLRNVNFFIPDTVLHFDFSKWLRNDFSQLSILLDQEYASDFTAVWYVKNVESETGVKSYNEIFSKAILPREFYGKIEGLTSSYYNAKLAELTKDDETFQKLGIEGVKETTTVQDIYGFVDIPQTINFQKDFDASTWNRFVTKIDGEYGCKGFYKLAPVFEYNPKMDLTASDKSFESDSADY